MPQPNQSQSAASPGTSPVADGSPSSNKSQGLSKLLQSGLIFSAISFLTGLGHLAFQVIIGHHLQSGGQFGDANSAVSGFLPLLSLLPAAATFTVTHFIAHYQSIGDRERLNGLFLGCRKFLLRLTWGGSLLVLLVFKPLGDYFNYSGDVLLVLLACALFGLWGSYATALCQGLGWFKRLALIGFLTMFLRFLFGWFVVLHHPTAVLAVTATLFALLANLVLLFWRKELAVQGVAVSPVNREFIHYLIVCTAFVVGNYCFLQGDLLVAKKFLEKADNDAYNCAKSLAVALPNTVAPLLIVLFTSRSGERHRDALGPQLRLLALYVVGLLTGAGMLWLVRGLCVKTILGHHSPIAEGMIWPLSSTMVVVGLLLALAQWSLASRWSRVTLLFGGLGIAYWLFLMVWEQVGGPGPSGTRLLSVMPVAALMSLAVLFGFWLRRMRRHHATHP
jgi:hypothetical protein